MSVKLGLKNEIYCESKARDVKKDRQSIGDQDEVRIRAEKRTNSLKDRSEWLLYLVKCVQKSVAASQRHAAASLRTNSRWLEKVTMSKSHINGEAFSKLHSWGTCPLRRDLSLGKGTGWWVTQSRLCKTHSLSSHCLCFYRCFTFIGQFFSIFDECL